VEATARRRSALPIRCSKKVKKVSDCIETEDFGIVTGRDAGTERAVVAVQVVTISSEERATVGISKGERQRYGGNGLTSHWANPGAGQRGTMGQTGTTGAGGQSVGAPVNAGDGELTVLAMELLRDKEPTLPPDPTLLGLPTRSGASLSLSFADGPCVAVGSCAALTCGAETCVDDPSPPS
jgi:hypothetical protein